MIILNPKEHWVGFRKLG